MNTRIEYDYRDGANYKLAGEIVITGSATEQQVKALHEACMKEDDHSFFVPEAVGMERLSKNPWDNEIDHPFHTLGDITPTDDEPTDPRTIEELIESFDDKDWGAEGVKHCGDDGNVIPMPVRRADAQVVRNIMR